MCDLWCEKPEMHRRTQSKQRCWWHILQITHTVRNSSGLFSLLSRCEDARALQCSVNETINSALCEGGVQVRVRAAGPCCHIQPLGVPAQFAGACWAREWASLSTASAVCIGLHNLCSISICAAASTQAVVRNQSRNSVREVTDSLSLHWRRIRLVPCEVYCTAVTYNIQIILATVCYVKLPDFLRVCVWICAWSLSMSCSLNCANRSMCPLWTDSAWGHVCQFFQLSHVWQLCKAKRSKWHK